MVKLANDDVKPDPAGRNLEISPRPRETQIAITPNAVPREEIVEIRLRSSIWR